MTYNSGSTLQKRFVTGRFTLAVLLSGALLLWVIYALSGASNSADDVDVLLLLPRWLRCTLSFAVYMAVAYIANSFVVIESRTPWLGGVLMWLTGLCFFAQESLFLPLSLLAFTVVLSVLLSCFRRPNVQLWVYSAFALLSFLTLFVPCAVYIFPLALVYMATTSVINVRNILSALLGLFTPVWVFYCLSFAVDGVSLFYDASLQKVADAVQLSLLPFTPYNVSLLVAEAVVMFPCAVVFARSSSPAKPLMRKMLTFFIMTGIFLWVLSFVRGNDFSLLFTWRLPSLSIMMAYLFTLKVNRFTNIYFIVVNILYIAVAALGIWNLI